VSENPKDSKTPRRFWRACGFGLMGCVLFVVLGLGLALYLMIDRQVNAPGWVRDRIEARIAETVPGLDIRFGQMSLLLQRSGLARVILWDVDIRNERQERIAQLSDIEAGLEPLALMKGQLELRDFQVSGAFVTLRRNEEGQLGLALGDAFAADVQTPALSEIMGQVDQALLDPRLAQLRLFDADALTIRYEDLRANRGWTADGGRLSLAREGLDLVLRADVALLGGGDGVATLEMQAQSEIGQSSVDLSLSLEGLRAGDIASQSPALAWLGDLDAPISGRMNTALDANGGLEHLSAALQIGAGVLQPNRETRALRFEEARTAFEFDPNRGLLSFDEIYVASPLGTVSSRGTAQLQGLDQGWPEALTGQIEISDLTLAEGALFERDLWMSGAASEFKLEFEPFRLIMPRLQIFDPDYPITANGELLARPDGWQFALDAAIEQTSVQQVLSFWPKDFQIKPREWVARNVRKGQLRDIVFALRSEPGSKPDTFIDFSFDGGEVSYAPDVPMVQEGVGRLTIYDKRLGLNLQSGVMRPKSGGEIALRDSQVIIPDLKAKPGLLELRLNALAPIGAMMSYLDNDNWQLLRKVGQSADLASGQAALSGRITTRLVKKPTIEDFTFDLNAQLTDVRSETLVQGRVLTSDDLRFRMNSKRIEISGAAQLDGVGATGRWTQPLQGGNGSVRATADISPRALSALGISLPKGMVTGRGAGQLEIDLRRGRAPVFRLSSDLAGLGLSIPQLGWRLSKGGKGRFDIAGELGPVPRIDTLSLKAARLDAAGALRLSNTGAFQQLDLSRFRVGNWLDVTGSLRGRGRQVPEITVTGGRVDMRASTFNAGASGGGGGAGPTPIRLALDELRITDTITLRNFSGQFQAGRVLDGTFRGVVGGQRSADINGRAFAQRGGTAFEITARDAGEVLKAAKLFKSIDDGQLRLLLIPVVGQRGTFDGTLKITETRLRSATAITELLDAISIVGLIDQANGPGIYFPNVDAKFRLSPSRVVVTESRAVGPSMGITLDGVVDLVSGKMSMQGVLSPVFFLNGIGQLISRPGEGLIGFNFDFQGTMKNPQVSVNPLSALTPGVFRDIFRRPPPRISQ
jgi:hypothetical protein